MPIDPFTRQPKIPAWTTSMVVHALLVLLLVFWVQRTPQGAAEEPLRDVGIVLKKATADGVKFEGEEDTPADQTADVNSPNPTVSEATASLPDIAAHSTASDALPTLPSVGPSEAGSAAASAAGMTEAGGTTGGRPGDIGEKGQTMVFGVQGVGTKFVYLFDRSASMAGPPLTAAKRELIESLDSLEEVHQFQIIFFNTRAAPFTIAGRKRIAFANEQNKRLAADQINSVTADMGTDRMEALKKALALGPDVIFFLTDADDPMSPAELREVLRRNQRYGAMISTIEFGRGPKRSGDNFLKHLARETGGGYGYVNTNRLR